PAAGGAIVGRPTGVNAGVAADQRAVVHGKPVRVAGTWGEVRSLQYLAGGGFISDQACPAFRIVVTVVPRDQPNGAIVPGDAVVARPSFHRIKRDEKFRFPSGRIHAKNAAQAQRRDPQFALMPERAVAAAAVV